MYQPHLARRPRACGHDERRPRGRSAALHVDAQSADADDVIIRDGPILARPAITGYVEDRRAFGRGTALNIEAKPAYSRYLTLVENPLLISPRVAGLDTQRRARDG